MTPSPETVATVETVKEAVTTASLLNHLKNNRVVNHSRKTENWFDTVILTVKNRPRNLLQSTRKRRTHAGRSDFFVSKVFFEQD